MCANPQPQAGASGPSGPAATGRADTAQAGGRAGEGGRGVGPAWRQRRRLEGPSRRGGRARGRTWTAMGTHGLLKSRDRDYNSCVTNLNIVICCNCSARPSHHNALTAIVSTKRRRETRPRGQCLAEGTVQHMPGFCIIERFEYTDLEGHPANSRRRAVLSHRVSHHVAVLGRVIRVGGRASASERLSSAPEHRT